MLPDVIGVPHRHHDGADRHDESFRQVGPARFRRRLWRRFRRPRRRRRRVVSSRSDVVLPAAVADVERRRRILVAAAAGRRDARLRRFGVRVDGLEMKKDRI